MAVPPQMLFGRISFAPCSSDVTVRRERLAELVREEGVHVIRRECRADDHVDAIVLGDDLYASGAQRAHAEGGLIVTGELRIDVASGEARQRRAVGPGGHVGIVGAGGADDRRMNGCTRHRVILRVRERHGHCEDQTERYQSGCFSHFPPPSRKGLRFCSSPRKHYCKTLFQKNRVCRH